MAELIKGCRCLKCFGCNRLEDKSFRGSFRCSNYIEAEDGKEVSKWNAKDVDISHVVGKSVTYEMVDV